MGERRVVVVLFSLAGLCLLAYLPALALPLIADDYLQIELGRQWGPVSAWPDLAQDALYRCRATSIVLTWWLDRTIGTDPVSLRVAQLALHVAATWLILAFGVVKRIGWQMAAVAAGFFAVYEGHQEAVIWFAAVPEVLVFLFVLASVLCWMLWLESGGHRHRWLAASMMNFLLALLSKESAAVAPALMALTVVVYPQLWRRIAIAVVPYGLLTAVYAALIFAAKSEHLHLNDGTFSLQAPVLLTLANSIGRLFWFWGALSLIVLLAWRKREHLRLVSACAIWIVVTFLPYVFIAYMPRVPSRHTYLASAGLAIVVGATFLTVREKLGPLRAWVPAALAAVIVLHNCGYLWTWKQHQYRMRAAPTEELVRLGKTTRKPIFVKCFPYGVELAVLALQQETGRSRDQVILGASHSPENAVEFCYEGN
jgi:hypothetical protein